jgi:predicted component of type VI protein secretion system
VELQLSLRSRSTGAVKQVRLSLDKPVVIGRGAENAVRLEGEGISREHVGISVRGSEVVAKDLSSNGSLINGMKMSKGGAQSLKDGDIIGVPGWDVIVDAIQATAGKPVALSASPPPAAANGFMGKIHTVLHSFTAMERFMTVLSLASIALLILYLKS